MNLLQVSLLALPVEGGWQQQSSYHMRFADVLRVKLQEFMNDLQFTVVYEILTF